MTAMTPFHTSGAFADQPDYTLGRADAYDDAHTRTLDQLVVLAGATADHATLPYAFGYMDRVLEMRLEQDAVTAAETELAYTTPTREEATR